MDNEGPFADHDFWMQLRRHWLGMVATVEKKLGIKPTTSEKADWWKQHSRDPTVNAVDFPVYGKLDNPE